MLQMDCISGVTVAMVMKLRERWMYENVILCIEKGKNNRLNITLQFKVINGRIPEEDGTTRFHCGLNHASCVWVS